MGCYTQRIICNSFHLALCEALCVSLLLLLALVRSLLPFYSLRTLPIVGVWSSVVGTMLMLLLLKYFISFKLLNIQKCYSFLLIFFFFSVRLFYLWVLAKRTIIASHRSKRRNWTTDSRERGANKCNLYCVRGALVSVSRGMFRSWLFSCSTAPAVYLRRAWFEIINNDGICKLLMGLWEWG